MSSRRVVRIDVQDVARQLWLNIARRRSLLQAKQVTVDAGIDGIRARKLQNIRLHVEPVGRLDAFTLRTSHRRGVAKQLCRSVERAARRRGHCDLLLVRQAIAKTRYFRLALSVQSVRIHVQLGHRRGGIRVGRRVRHQRLLAGEQTSINHLGQQLARRLEIQRRHVQRQDNHETRHQELHEDGFNGSSVVEPSLPKQPLELHLEQRLALGERRASFLSLHREHARVSRLIVVRRDDGGL